MDVKIRSKYEDAALKNYMDHSLNRNNSSGATMGNGHIRSNGYLQVSQVEFLLVILQQAQT